MNQTYTKSQKIRLLFYILIPILITQISMYAMTFFDVMMSGQYSTQDVAGVSIGSSLWTPVYTGLSGILIALTPVVSQLVGSRQSKSVSYSVMQAIYLAVALALIILIIGAFSLNPVLNAMDLEDSVHMVAHDYLIALSLGIIPLFIYNALRAFIDALGQTRISMIITLCALPVNVLFNYLLIYGKFGFPELGGVGSGYATAITYWLIALVAILVVIKINPFSTYQVFTEFFRVSWKEWKALLLIGVPIGLAIFFETSIFSAVTLLMSKYDTVTIASHQIAMNFASLLYMIPLSISMALTIVIGFEIGAARYKDAKEYSWIGISMALTMSLVLSTILFLFREPVAFLYTKDHEVMMLTSHFLIYAIFFQISDALQAPIQGILRGYKDVNVTFAMSLVSYWILGLPIGYFFAKFTDMGAFGYWIGLISGLALGAIGLAARLRFIQRVKYKKMA
ncbi:MATE family efflux transporter [Bacillus sp. AFS043905]|uniref:MATE family efflux transporter n=1 Tax=Peribacillus TaxID=2675229 RepID=UPI000BFD88C2|nr:MATE family efflux transporter [Peribacillus frigoritolerans]MDP9740610.1 MATE family multidrug resistance protein [Bacillus sp. B2I3]PHD78100.1 MATE family efflux transporter [Bacillus sp. AFS043905]MCY8936731.1 MATE family efflux transporter [Peribacillus frigoritolerans]MCY8940157.1 MATE family efflux transporter [Peribacillus frigoritolerans]MCY8940230.1 MATE family efflux transporter [Peribacillus frigoritolerans]